MGGVLAIALTLMMSSRIVHQLQAAIVAVKQIAAGKLNTRLPPASRDEVGEVVRALGEMQDALKHTMSHTHQGANQVAESARQLRESAQQVNDSANVQSSAAAAIAASIEELTVSIGHVAERTGDAARLAGDSDKEASDGKTTVDRLVHGMGQMIWRCANSPPPPARWRAGWRKSRPIPSRPAAQPHNRSARPKHWTAWPTTC